MTGETVSNKQLQAISELAHRNAEALSMFRPMEHQEPIFSHNRFREALWRGGNRSGKSVCSAVLFASAVMGLPVTFNDGRQFQARRSHQKGQRLLCWIIGYDQKHIGQTLYRLLFARGLFKIIRDKTTNQWRSYREWDPEDKAREDEVKDSPPLIPRRYVDPNSWDWESKKGKEFKKVTIWDPVTHEPIADIHAYSSKGDPKAGDPVSIIWIDEAVANPEHYPEWQARLVDKKGFMFWSSWPAEDNEALRRLDERAEECLENGTDLVHRVVLRTSQNKQLDQQSIEDMKSGFSAEESLARDAGEFNTANFRFYPLFDKKVHSALTGPGIKEDRLSEILRETNGVPPSNWCRILSLDPGTQHPAVLFCAVPPPDLGDYWVVFDELYPGRADAIQLAEMIMRRTRGDVFNKFVIDWRAGRQTSMGASQTNAELYAKAFHQHRLKSELTGSGFQNGCDNPGYRAGLVRSALHTNSHGFPKLRIVTHKCPKLVRQMETVMKKRIKQIVDEERKSDSMPYDLTDALEYFAACGPAYLEPRDSLLVGESSALRLLRLLQSKAKKDKTESAQLGPSY